jgi:hypothetical protein
MDPTTIVVALIVAVPSTIGPLLGLLVAARIARKKLEAAQEREDARYKRQDKKLDGIHTLVNSSMTAAMESELAGLRRERVMMVAIIDLKRSAGQEPTPDEIAEVKATEAKVEELERELAERAEAQKLAELQLARLNGEDDAE